MGNLGELAALGHEQCHRGHDGIRRSFRDRFSAWETVEFAFAAVAG